MSNSTTKKEEQGDYQLIRLPATDGGQEIVLEADLSIPRNGHGIVIFAHGSGSSRHSPRNRYVAQVLQNEGIATLLTDLLTEQEEEIDLQTRHLRFDIGLLSQRLSAVTYWLNQKLENMNFKIGYFGASTWWQLQQLYQQLSVLIPLMQSFLEAEDQI